jgi:Protein of unknown function (DUF3592)
MTSGAEAASLPPELAQPLPRRVRSTGWFKLAIALVTVPLLGFCLLFLGIMYAFHHDRSILRASGVPVEGQITGLEITRSKSSNSYHVRYRFQPHSDGIDQHVQTGADVVSEAHYRYLSVGEIVPVVYEPDRPGNSGLKFDDSVNTSDDSTSMLLLALFFIGAAGGIYVLFLALILFPYFKQKRLLRWGHAAFATILREEEVGWRRPTMTATFQFTDEQGRSIVGIQKGLPSAKRLRRPGFRAFREGVMKMPIAIYDPKNPANSMLYRAGSAICH